MDENVIEVPEDLTGLSAEELSALLERLIAGATQLCESEDATDDAFDVVENGLAAVRGEMSRRAEQRAQMEARRARVMETLRPATPEAAEATPEQPEEAAEPAAQGPAAEAQPEPEEAAEAEPVLVPASAARQPRARLDLAQFARQSPAPSPEPVSAEERIGLHAAAGGSRGDAGRRIPDWDGLASEFTDRMRRAGRTGSDTVMVASAGWLDRYRTDDGTYIADPTVDATDVLLAAAEGATPNLSRTTAETWALTAALAPCGPPQPLYDVMVCSDRGRPIWDSLRKIGANRGQITYLGPPTVPAGAVGVDDCGVASNKTCADVTCTSAITECVDAIYGCLTVSNSIERFNPEYLRSWISTMYAMLDRTLEAATFAAIKAHSTEVTIADALGALPDLLAGLARTAEWLAGVNRSNRRYRVVIPSWVAVALQTDFFRAPSGVGLDQYQATEAQIAASLASVGVDVTWSYPGDLGYNTAPVAAAAVPDLPTSANLLMYEEGSMVGLDGGELNLGFFRDAGLVSANKSQWFAEEFVGVAKLGCTSLSITIDLCPSGARAPAGTAITCGGGAA